MEFGFKETKSGYAKAEVDAYILKLQNQVDELQLRNINVEKEHYAVSLRTFELKKNALLKSKKIINDTAETAYKFNTETYSGLQRMGKIKETFNNVVKSKVQKIEDEEMSTVLSGLNSLQDELSLSIRSLDELYSTKI